MNDHGINIHLMRTGHWYIEDDDGVVATGVRKNGMYVPDVKKPNTLKLAAMGQKKRTLMKWHRSLGHLNFADVLRLADKLYIKTPDEIPECKTCLLAKITRKPRKSNNKDKPKIEATEVLERIHTDLSGAIRTHSAGGYKYFLTFIDDYSRYLTVYMIKSKEEVYQKYCDFKAMVKNQFGKKIKKVRSDNGTEYTNQRFQKVLKDSGIQHELTNVDSSFENGVAERINY